MSDDAEPRALLDLTVYLLSRTARLGKRALDDALAARGFRLRHLAVLAALAEGGQASQLALGKHVRLDPSDVTATLDELERRGLIERVVDPADRRRRRVGLTAAGEGCLDELRALAVGVADDLLAPLDPARRQVLHDDLTLILESAGVS
jgi:DNA-binding MarR family transcriptional regulator